MIKRWTKQTQNLLWCTTLVDDLEREREGGGERERESKKWGIQLLALAISYHIATNEVGSICSLAAVKTRVVNDLLGSLCVCVCVSVCE